MILLVGKAEPVLGIELLLIDLEEVLLASKIGKEAVPV